MFIKVIVNECIMSIKSVNNVYKDIVIMYQDTTYI